MMSKRKETGLTATAVLKIEVPVMETMMIEFAAE